MASNPPIQVSSSPTHAASIPTSGSGWSAIANVVREVDEVKIKDQKEDIDTLLTFAGLFSAALTAFLIESYQNLRQDPSDVMISLLQQLVTQTNSYTFVNGHLNSTTGPPTPSFQSPFQPSVNAMRVNILWFASLMLSLMSASFGILVKQWLREYLADEQTYPLARLRIRHFRNPGLSDWKVFEIAAVLPMLLQLALAFFFVGLCFFTSDVHSSIGHTTLPLVAAWAFLFLAVSLAPAVSPRCPYKTPLLKLATKTMRSQLYKGVVALREWMHKPPGLGDVVQGMDSFKWSYRSLAMNEADVAASEKDDLNILIKVDEILSNVQLLNVIWETLQQTQFDPSDAVEFLCKTVGHRLQRSLDAPGSGSMFADLKALPKQMFATITGMAMDVLQRELDRHAPTGSTNAPPSSTMALKKSLGLLLADTSHPLPDSTMASLAHCLSAGRHRAILESIKIECNDALGASRMLAKFHPALVQMSRSETDMYVVLQDLLRQCFCHGDGCAAAHNDLIAVIRDHPEIGPAQLQPLVDIFVQRAQAELDVKGNWELARVKGLQCLIGMAPRLETSQRDAVVALVRRLITGRDDWMYMAEAASLDHPYPHIIEPAQALFHDAFVECSMPEHIKILSSFEELVRSYWPRNRRRGLQLPTGQLWLLDPLHFLKMQLRLFAMMQDRADTSFSYNGYLRGLDEYIVSALEAVMRAHRAGHRELAWACLETIDELEPCPVNPIDAQAFEAWADAFRPDESAFTDDLVDALLRFTVGEADGSHLCARVRRLRMLDSRADGPANYEPAPARSRTRTRLREYTPHTPGRRSRISAYSGFHAPSQNFTGEDTLPRISSEQTDSVHDTLAHDTSPNSTSGREESSNSAVVSGEEPTGHEGLAEADASLPGSALSLQLGVQEHDTPTPQARRRMSI